MKLSALKSLNRKVSLATVTFLAASTFANLAIATTTNAPDNSSTREIVISALQGDSSATTNSFGNNDGTMQDTTGQNPLANIGFSAIRIVPATNGVADSTKSDGTMSATDSSTYVTVGSAITGTTDATGTATLTIGAGNANDGYYLVTETTTVDGEIEVKPFIVQVPLNDSGTTGDGNWQYDVYTYPKINAQSELSQDKVVSTTGNINDGTGTDKQASVWAGQAVTWFMSTIFPQTMAVQQADGTTSYGTYTVTDQLNSALNFVDNSLSFSVGYQDQTTHDFSAMTTLTLALGTDYTFSNTNGLLSLTLQPSGINKILTAQAALQPAVANGDTYAPVFVPSFQTTINPDYVSQTLGNLATTPDNSDATAAYSPNYVGIGNGFTPTVTNAYGLTLTGSGVASNENFPGPGDPDGPDNTITNTAQVYLGTVKVNKIDATSGAALNGATFAIATSMSNAQQGLYVQQDPSTGALYADPADIPAGEVSYATQADADAVGAQSGTYTINYTQTTGTSGTNGLAEFDGLVMYDSNQVTTTADGVTEGVTLSGANNSTGQTETGAIGVAGTNTPYYLVETQAPTGYNTLSDPIQVMATIDGSLTSTVDDSDNNINLPFTGSQGFIIMMIVAGIAGGSAIVIHRKKIEKEAARKE